MQLRRNASFLVLLWGLFCLPGWSRGEPAGRVIDFENGLQMELLEAGDRFLGIGEIRVRETVLRTGGSPVFPLVAADWSFPHGLYTNLRLTEIRPLPNGWELVIELRESTHETDWSRFFMRDEAGQLVRDDFFFARTTFLGSGYINASAPENRLPERAHADESPSGYLIWKIEVIEDSIAGWPWTGWQWSFSGEIENGPPLTCFRLLSGWALGGGIDGLTLANQRYRGLGYPSQTLADSGNGSLTCWSTQDLLVPNEWKGHSAEMDRHTALALRAESSIHVPARGAGTGFIDYQFRPKGALAAFPERQGNVRSLTEIYPGDRIPVQLDEELFEATQSWETVPLRYLVLTTETPQPDHFWQTRYLELEQQVRATVAAELGFVETPVLPTVGALFDFWKPGDGFAQVVARLGAHAGRWAELGVRRIMVHNPGWKNGRAAQREWDGATRAEFVGGRVNTVYDWWPLPDVESAWQNTHAALQELGIEYYIWITGMTHRDAGFHHLVGNDPTAWASNRPDGTPSPIYGEETLKHNILSDQFRAAFDSRLDDVRRTFGYEGFWTDSFHNLFLSQLDWRGHDGMPQQRAWWEWASQKTREGLGWISESQSFPGLSCSIETDRWERDPWLMGNTIKWLRGHAQWERSPENWLPVAYRLMAFNAWLAPETWLYEVDRETQPDTVIADFGRLAREFLAARSGMDRPYVLPDDRGVLWFSSTNKGEGILFPFKRFWLPGQVKGSAILDTFPIETGRASPWRTLLVQGDELIKSFGLQPPPGEDVRPSVSAYPAEAAKTGQLDGRTPDHPPVLQYTPITGRIKETTWDHDLGIWKMDTHQEPQPWPPAGGVRAFFPANSRVNLPIQGHVRAAGIQTVTRGVELVIDTLEDGGPGSILELNGPLLGPCTVYFKNTLREDGWPHSELRLQTGLQFRGGGVYDLEADLLPWPGERNLHSQIVGLDDPGTTVHFRGYWDAKGELCRPGLVLGDETRFVIWPEARMSFVKDYGGFTLQLWVTGTGNRGGTLELHPEFVADRSRIHVSRTQPRAADLIPEALGSIRIGGATLVTHASNSLPMTGRSMHDEADTIQNNGHLVFEDRGTNRWIVRSRDQRYRGAVWIDHDLEIRTERDLMLEGVTEDPDLKFHYTAANAFQTRRKRNSPEDITIRKTGPAALVLCGEQAYVEGSSMLIEEGRVEFRTDPAAGRTFPRGEPQTGIHLQLAIGPDGQASWAGERVRLNSLQAEQGAVLAWKSACLVSVASPVRLSGTPVWQGIPVEAPLVLMVAPRIEFSKGALPQGWRVRDAAGRMQLVYSANQTMP